jgi:hypothetical protein
MKGNRPPGRDELLETLGTARERWVRLEGWVRDTYRIAGEPIFFGRESGWSVRYRRGGRTLFTLIPRLDCFRALVVVGPSAWAGAAVAKLSDTTRAAWEAAHPYPDGRRLWLDIVDERAASDVECLVALKSPAPTRLRAASSV